MIRRSPARHRYFHLGRRDVPRDGVELVHQGHVLRFVHPVPVRQLHGARGRRRRLGADPRVTQPGPDQPRGVHRAVSGPTGQPGHFTNLVQGKERTKYRGKKPPDALESLVRK